MNISDFSLVEYLLRNLCNQYSCIFVDLPLDFSSDVDSVGHVFNGKLVVGAPEKLNQMMFQIFSTYIQNIDDISGKHITINPSDKIDLINAAISILRDFVYAKDQHHGNDLKETAVVRLNRFPLVLMIMRDIVCPLYERPLKNSRVVAAKTPFIEGAKLVTNDEFNTKDTPADMLPFVYLNLEIENIAVQSGYLLREVLKDHGLEPAVVFGDLLAKVELRSKLIGLAKMAFVESDLINSFLMTLAMSISFSDTDSIMVKDATSDGGKLWSQAQYSGGTWGYLALIEKMLEPSRGSDWTAYNDLKPLTDDLWTKIEKEKKLRGLPQLPIELLLRVQSEDFKNDPALIIQGLLSDNRVW